MELLHAFGIDIKLVIANLLNFGILMFILYKLAYQPILNFVHERNKTIEEGVKNAEEAARALENAQANQEAIEAAARKEAQNIIVMARTQAESQAQGIVEKSQAEAESLLVKAKAQGEQERQSMMKEAQKQIGTLVVLLSEKIINEKMDVKLDQKLIEEALDQIKAA